MTSNIVDVTYDKDLDTAQHTGKDVYGHKTALRTQNSPTNTKQPYEHKTAPRTQNSPTDTKQPYGLSKRGVGTHSQKYSLQWLYIQKMYYGAEFQNFRPAHSAKEAYRCGAGYCGATHPHRPPRGPGPPSGQIICKVKYLSVLYRS